MNGSSGLNGCETFIGRLFIWSFDTLRSLGLSRAGVLWFTSKAGMLFREVQCFKVKSKSVDLVF